MQRHHWLGVLSAILLAETHPLDFHCFILRHLSHPNGAACVPAQAAQRIHTGGGVETSRSGTDFFFPVPPVLLHLRLLVSCVLHLSCSLQAAPGLDTSENPKQLRIIQSRESSHHRIFCCNLNKSVRRQSHTDTRHRHTHTHGAHMAPYTYTVNSRQTTQYMREQIFVAMPGPSSYPISDTDPHRPPPYVWHKPVIHMSILD
ncbi:hypothetical protein LZ32DRAFT_387812 [Colletotrichum eremochloae]|nr:hypothetical protein LZ32DRAFT_387812 [Colletotrichum eremochloae]